MTEQSLKPLLIASHPRSGTHVSIDFVRRQFLSTWNWRFPGWPNDHVYLNIERLGASSRRFSEATARRIVTRPRRAILKTHFNPQFTETWMEAESFSPADEWLSLIDRAIKVYVVRHPLDVMCSYYQFSCGIDPRHEQGGFLGFVFGPHWCETKTRLEWWKYHVQEWVARKDVTALRYEDIVSSPESTLNKLGHLLDEKPKHVTPLLPPKISSVFQSRMQRLLYISPQSTAIVALKNRYPMFDWRRNLSPAELSEITDVVGPLMDAFCYDV